MRRPEGERWNQEEFSHAIGTPWEPDPGRHHIEIKAMFSMKDDDVVEKIELQSRDFKPRGMYIRREDLKEEKYGMTPGCRGCEAADRGIPGINNERCRLRVEKAIEEKEPDRYARVMARLGTELQPEEKSGDKKRTSSQEERDREIVLATPTWQTTQEKDEKRRRV